MLVIPFWITDRQADPFLGLVCWFLLSGQTRSLVSYSDAGVAFVFYGEFDPGSGRTLAACLTHASRTLKQELALVDEWRTGE